MNHELQTARAWVKRRADKGIKPTADELWRYIKRLRPRWSEAEQEALFQGV